MTVAQHSNWAVAGVTVLLTALSRNATACRHAVSIECIVWMNILQGGESNLEGSNVMQLSDFLPARLSAVFDQIVVIFPSCSLLLCRNACEQWRRVTASPVVVNTTATLFSIYSVRLWSLQTLPPVATTFRSDKSTACRFQLSEPPARASFITSASVSQYCSVAFAVGFWDVSQAQSRLPPRTKQSRYAGTVSRFRHKLQPTSR